MIADTIIVVGLIVSYFTFVWMMLGVFSSKDDEWFDD